MSRVRFVCSRLCTSRRCSRNEHAGRACTAFWTPSGIKKTMMESNPSGSHDTIFHIITRLDRGGSARNTFLTALGHDRKRFRVGLVYGRSVPLRSEEAALMKVDLQQLSQAGVSLFRVPTLVREINPLLDVRATVALWRLVRRARPAPVHTPHPQAGGVGRVAG